MYSAQAYELDFLPVGKETKSGDAIAMRYGTVDNFEIMVIDGGDRSAGQDMVAHIREHYGNPDTIQHVVCTHCDGDHVSGLRDVIDAFEVDNLWVHQPWKYAAQLLPAFKYRWSEEGLRRHLREDCFPIVAELCDTAEARGITLREPFAGSDIGPFRVMAPSYHRLLELVPQMSQTPDQKVVAMTESFLRKALAAVLSVFESWDTETLKDPGVNGTSVANETSVVMYSPTDGGMWLTSDGGVGALGEAIEYAAAYGVMQRPGFIQIPHHGSRHNVSPLILDSILGPKLEEKADPPLGTAFTSAAAKAERPRKVVENAFTRRGYGCSVTKGVPLLRRAGFPNRPGYTYGLTPAPLHTFVEE